MTSTEVKANFSAVLRRVEATGESIEVTNHGRVVARIVAAETPTREFGYLDIVIPDDFDAPLPDTELDAWEGR